MNAFDSRTLIILFLTLALLIGCSSKDSSDQLRLPKDLREKSTAHKKAEHVSNEKIAPTEEPILLVHGFMDTTNTPWWDSLKNHLHDKGYPKSVIHSVNFANVPYVNISDPTSNASVLQKKINAIHRETGSEIDLICHSLGGIVCRYYVERMQGASFVDDLVTLASPHQGTYYSYMWYYLGAGRKTVPSSDFLDRLNNSGLASTVEYTNVWGSVDFAYMRSSGSKLPQQLVNSHSNARNIWAGYFTHSQLVSNQSVLDQYVQYLD